MNSGNSVEEIKLEKVEFVEEIYFRNRTDRGNIKQLLEKLKAGMELSPLVVQKIEVDGGEKIIALDGKHRVLAYEEFNKLDEDYDEVEEVEVKFWKIQTLDLEKHRDELLIRAYRLNDNQGLNVRPQDTKRTAKLLRRRNLSWSSKKISKKLNRAKSTIHFHIKEIIQGQKASENSQIMRLSRFGLKQREIPDHPDVCIGRSAISKRVKRFELETFSRVHNLSDSGKSIDAICDIHDINIPTAWSIILDGKPDLERFEIFGRSEYGDDKPKVCDKWEFSIPDKRIGKEYPGKIWGQNGLNILYHHSDQEDLVVDPMAEGGSMIDACLIMNRKRRAYDIKPARGDMLQNDIMEEFFEEAEGCDLIFLDSPHYKMKEEEHDCEEFTKDKETFFQNTTEIAENSYRVLGEGGKLALLFGNCRGYNGVGDVWSAELFNLFKDKGFSPKFCYQVPYPANIFEGYDVNRAREKARSGRFQGICTPLRSDVSGG